MSDHEKLSLSLAVTLAPLPRENASYLVQEEDGSAHYLVAVHKFANPKDAGAAYMKAGLPGETCECCKGSGIKEDS